MNKLEKTFSLLSVFFAVLIFSFLIYIVWNYAKNSALYSCVYSAGVDLIEYSPELHNLARSSENWYVLTDDEAKFALKSISFRRCSQSDSQPQDMKERNFKIAVIKSSEYGFRIIVWSRGFDNISGTADDIVFPRHEKVPN